MNLFQERLFIESHMSVAGMATVTSFDTLVDIAGTITPSTPNAILKLVGNDTFNTQASIVIPSGFSLSLLEDDEPAAITLTGPAKSLAGNGTLQSDVTLTGGAFVSPGASAGTFTIEGDLTVGSGAVYFWEIATSGGTPGTNWDLLRVTGGIDFAATSANPWVLKVNDLPNTSRLTGQPILIASAESILSFDPGAVRIDVSGILDTYPSFNARQFSLYSDGANLYLRVVPEPTTIAIFLSNVLLSSLCIRAPRFHLVCSC
jgi:hypothetical protein